MPMLPASSAAPSTPAARSEARLLPRGSVIPFVLVTVLFFLWGIPNNVNDVLIRQFMKSFVITRFEAGLVQSAFYLGYFLLAMPAALLMRRWGYKSGFLIGLALFSTGTFLFWPAAVAGRYIFFLIALFVIASGLSFLETAANPFIAQLGDPATAARRLNLAQAFNPLGAISGVFFGTLFIFSGVELQPHQVAELQARHAYAAYLQSETMRVVIPYLVLGVLALVMLILIAITRFPSSLTRTENAEEAHGSLRALFGYPHFLLAVVAQFLYVGAQVGTWSYFIPYVQSYAHEPEKMAGYLLTGSLVAFGVGRFSSAWLMQYVSPAKLMAAYCAINAVLVAIGVIFPGWAGLWALLITSFFMSLMFPTIFVLGLRGLGENTKVGGSLLVMAIVGGAVLTPIMGMISVRSGSVALAYLVPLLAYIFIGCYSFADQKLFSAHTSETSASAA
ncbi:FHS family L-fucose permease-like MFS transporter [Silvibacterium bohemicum]|uniref:FHS family L-fucose permease-like MFS transporter n=1 Tax=Silvibacterium bohemicum TaxID=1577686 RepID=A0A841JZJ2_9BACT|nr:L-fucose:H+ symporter permease [Silvibacterium bohemicum]MBB6143414.1 FHS family L-fucose permease-like MFS transporter [Silvibacterium bohemicum]